MKWSELCLQVNVSPWLETPPQYDLIISPCMPTEKTQKFIKANILFFSPIFNGCVETNALGLSNCRIL